MNLILVVKELIGDYQEVLRRHYIQSEFLDPVDGIIGQIENKTEPAAQGFGCYLNTEMVAFFLIVESIPNLKCDKNSEGLYWMDSFFVTPKYKGKGFAKSVVFEIIRTMKKVFPEATCLNLTVNFRNHVAKKIYEDCGLVDTGDVYFAGAAGPQHIYSIILGG